MTFIYSQNIFRKIGKNINCIVVSAIFLITLNSSVFSRNMNYLDFEVFVNSDPYPANIFVHTTRSYPRYMAIIDTLINPKRVTVNAIVNRATSTDEIEGMEELEGGDASVREFLIKNKNGKTGKKLSDLNLPDDTLIAMINREGEAIFPDSESSLEENDHVLVFTLKTKLPEVENFFH